MKNKSKLKKIREKKSGSPGIPKEWLYMQEHTVSVRDISVALEGEPDINVEVWEEAGVLEVEIPEQRSMDFEQTKAQFPDEYSRKWLAEHGVKTMFLVTIDAEHYENAKKLMQVITKKIGGFFCGDTEDFMPLIK